MGLGLGYVPFIGGPQGTRQKSRGGIGFNFLVGHGWDDRNLTVLEINLASTLDMTSVTCAPAGPEPQSFGGVVWYHYLEPSEPTVHAVLGVGVYGYDEEYGGIGLLTGLGIEPLRHFQLTGYILLGDASDSGKSFGFAYLSVLFTALAF